MFPFYVHKYTQNHNLEAEVRRLRLELQQYNVSMGRESVRLLTSMCTTDKVSFQRCVTNYQTLNEYACRPLIFKDQALPPNL